jgi:hypothetical protein
MMACYAGFLVTLTLHLQSGLGLSPLAAGSIFAAYAVGFAVASTGWVWTPTVLHDRLPVVGPLLMGTGLLGIALVAAGGSWPLGATTPLLAGAGVGHALAFSPLTSRLTTLVDPSQAGDLSGLVITASLVGQALGVAGFVGVYFSAAGRGSARAFALTTGVLAFTLLPTSLAARVTVRRSP